MQGKTSGLMIRTCAHHIIVGSLHVACRFAWPSPSTFVLVTQSQCSCIQPIFQGDIHKTRGGGTSVQFTDVEVLKHSRPKTPAGKERLRKSTRLASQARPGSTQRRGAGIVSDNSLSSVTSTSGESSPESSVAEWTDVETRVRMGEVVFILSR